MIQKSLLLILIVLATTLSGYWIYQNQTKSNLSTSPSPFSNSETPSPILTQTPIPSDINQPNNKVADKTWKGLGVTFNYPASWEANKPVSTILKPQSGGSYQQSFTYGKNMNL